MAMVSYFLWHGSYGQEFKSHYGTGGFLIGFIAVSIYTHRHNSPSFEEFGIGWKTI
jgi:hypothetical protein